MHRNPLPVAPLPVAPLPVATGKGASVTIMRRDTHAWVTYLLSFIIHVLLITSHDHAFSILSFT